MTPHGSLWWNCKLPVGLVRGQLGHVPCSPAPSLALQFFCEGHYLVIGCHIRVFQSLPVCPLPRDAFSRLPTHGKYSVLLRLLSLLCPHLPLLRVYLLTVHEVSAGAGGSCALLCDCTTP